MKHNNTYETKKRKIALEANDWFLKIQSQSMTPEAHSDFLLWLDENPVHKEEYDLINAIWEGSGILENDTLAIKDLKEEASEFNSSKREKWTDNFNIHFLNIKSFAAAAMVLIIATGIWLVQTNTKPYQSYQTAIGEQKAVYLNDSSTIHLDTKTIIHTSFTMDERHVALKEGRAFFDVGHDPDRPFVVTAGNFTIRALGTQFNIYKENKDKIIVTVTQGRVQINKGNGTPPSSQKKLKELISTPKPALPLKTAKSVKKIIQDKGILVSGQEVVLEEKKIDYKVKVADTKHVNSWREGKLFFKTTPLVDVIDEINRYLENDISFGDESLKAITVSMILNISHRHNFINALEKIVPIKSRTTSNGKIILYKKET